MNYKQKYNKLVEAVKVLQETNPSDEGIQNWVSDNVPELAESKDEKVRKWVYNYFRSCFPTWIHPDITCEEILTWLEKQRTSYTERDVDDAYVEGMAFAKDELEKQGEQKHALDIEIPFGANDSELQEATYLIPEGFHAEIKDNEVLIKKGKQKLTELHTDEQNLNACLDYIPDEFLRRWLTNIIHIKDNKPIWSEEDEQHIKELESLVKQVWAIAEHENDKDNIHKMSDLSFFLKTLKPQLKQEWSEEDEVRLQACIDTLQAKSIMGKVDTVMTNWLKSLKQRYTWKPSDEEMNAFKQAYDWYNTHSAQSLALNSLYNDLKKLKGE